MTSYIDTMKITVDKEEAVQLNYGQTKTFVVEVKTLKEIEGKVNLIAKLIQEQQDVIIGELQVEMPVPKTYKFSFDITFKQQYQNMYEALQDEAIFFDLIVKDEINRVVYLVMKEDQKKEFYIREEDFGDDCCCSSCCEEFYEDFGEEEFEEYEEGEEFYEDLTEQELQELQENIKKNSELKQMPFTDSMSKRLVFTIVKLDSEQN